MEAGQPGWSVWDGQELAERAAPLFDACVIALGTFDGVHVGHRQIFDEAVALGRERGWPAVAFTFDRHPAATIAPLREPPLLTSFEQRLSLILETGISHVIVVRFDEAFSQVRAEDFARRILAGGVGARAIVVGRDFRFGYRARGDVELLGRLAEELGYALRVVPPVTHHGEKVSSTTIRAQIARGDVAGAARLLGRPFSLEGVAACGEGRATGRAACLVVVPGLIIPADGVYATRVSARGAGIEARPALTAIGARTQGGSGERAIQTVLLDFEGDLCGGQLRVEFLARLGDIPETDGKAQLARGIEAGIGAARAYFAQLAAGASMRQE